MSEKTGPVSSLEDLIRAHVPEDLQARALEEAALLRMQAERDTAHHRQQREMPEQFKGPRARKALTDLQTAFKRATGMNIFDQRSEELVRAAWATVHAIVTDVKDKCSESYENSGIYDTPDLDLLTELDDLLEIPGNLNSLLWVR